MLKYEKPSLEELELIIEGSFLGENSIGIKKGDKDVNDEDMDNWD